MTEPIVTMDAEQMPRIPCRCCGEIKDIEQYPISETFEHGMTIKNVEPVCLDCQDWGVEADNN